MTQQVPPTAAFAPPTREQWLALVEKDLKGAPFEKRLVTQLIEGLTIQPLYTESDAPSADAMGLPGQAPFVRGASGLRAGAPAWSILSEHRHPLPVEANRAILSDIHRGAHGVVVRLSPRSFEDGGAVSHGQCGCGGGVLVDTLDDLDRVFHQVELGKLHLTVHAGAAFMASAAGLLSLYAQRGVAESEIRCNFGADPLGVLAARGTLPRPAETLLAELGSLARSTARLPNARAVVVSTAPYDNAGATAVQELAAAMATAVTYLRAMEDAGMSVTDAARQLTFSLAVGADQFLDIAKFRALRALYNRILEAAEVPEAKRSIRVHARTSRRILTQRDPWVNVLRTTIGCFAAALGGAEEVTILPFDDVIGPSDELAMRLARNTQIVLQEEGHLGDVLDAAGGSYYVEHLTLDLAQAAWKQFQEIERRGGMLAALRDGSVAKEIEATRQKRAKDLARRKIPITGVSEFPHLGEKPVVRTKVDTTAHEAELAGRRKQRAADASLSAALKALQGQSGDNLLKGLTAAASRGATLHMLNQALGTSGNASETVTALHLHRFAEPFEKLRDQSDLLLQKSGQRPRVFSANMGPIAMHTARAMFAQNFFEAGGFEVVTNDGFADVAAAASAFERSGTKRVVICSSDAWYDGSACELGRALKHKGAIEVILAGNPGQNEAKYREAGINRFIYIGCDVLGTLTELSNNANLNNQSAKNESTAS